MRRTLILMVKEPRPGRVKTRLGRDIGMVEAAWWFRRQTQRLIRRLRDPRWQILLAVSPDAAGLSSRIWPADLARMAQGRGDLGRRMLRMIRQVPRGPVCVIGADIPGIERPHVARAFAALARADVVFGPATDGGYWLIGTARPRLIRADALDGVRWSGPHALADSIACLPGVRIVQTDRLSDVDTAADLASLLAMTPALRHARREP